MTLSELHNKLIENGVPVNNGIYIVGTDILHHNQFTPEEQATYDAIVADCIANEPPWNEPGTVVL